MPNAEQRGENSGHMLICSQQCNSAPPSASAGAKQCKSQLWKLGLSRAIQCNNGTKLIELGCVCVCGVHTYNPARSTWCLLGFFSPPPTDAALKTPNPTVSFLSPHYRGCCQLEGQGSRQRISLINTPRADQSTWIFASTNKTLAFTKTKEWEEKERQKELGGVWKRRM